MSISNLLQKVVGLGFLFVAVLPPPPAGAKDIASDLVLKIRSAGLGCNDAKAAKERIMFSPKRITCTIEGEKTNIEVYTLRNLRKANAYLCKSGLDFPFLTDRKRWSIYFDSAETMKAVQEIVGGSVITTCEGSKK